MRKGVQSLPRLGPQGHQLPRRGSLTQLAGTRRDTTPGLGVAAGESSPAVTPARSLIHLQNGAGGPLMGAEGDEALGAASFVPRHLVREHGVPLRRTS